MMAHGEHTDQPASNWTIHVSDVRTVKVSNISLATSVKDIRDFFSFSGEIQYIEMLRESERTQASYVTFKESKEADTAVLLTGASIGDHCVSITPVEDYQLPPHVLPSGPAKKPTPAAVKKAEDVVSTMLAKGFIVGKDAINRAKSFDERHCLTSNASATVASIDHKMRLRDKLSVGTGLLNEIVKEMNDKLLISEMTKSAFAAADNARSAVVSNPYLLTGASWLSSAYTVIANAVGNVSMRTKEKVEDADKFGRTHLDGALPVFSAHSGRVDM
ncbi:hypothetical protein K1719_043075 [Acacia pycnantha]|nr:hypothetical protein K1719_043075 [Acacia pycnantha]